MSKHVEPSFKFKNMNFDHQEWGTICATEWDLAEAEVICRQLKYSGAESAVYAFDMDITPLSRVPMIPDLICAGSELNIEECLITLKSNSFCSPEYAGAVVCTGKICCILNKCLFIFLDYQIVVTSVDVLSDGGNVIIPV